MDARTAYLITDILSDNYARRSTFGAGSPLHLSRPAAAKTGTTQDWRDNWTVGYTPELAVGVWVGNADNEPMRNVSGVTGAAPIWRDLMEELLKTRPIRQFPVPDGLVEKTVCTINGLIPAESFRPQVSPESGDPELLQASPLPTNCPHTITERFIEGMEPRRVDDWHQAIALDRRTGLRAGPGCPLDVVIFQTFTRYPAEAEAWARKQGVPEPPAIYSPLCPNQEPVIGQSANGEGENVGVSDLPPGQALVFTSPDQGTVFRLVPNIPLDKQKIRVAVRPVDGVNLRQVSLFVNGQPLAEGWETLWQMTPGDYIFEARGLDAAGNELTANRVTISVVE
jgi:membrane carboxypeptidase/penicillin-binding protein PbpC